ncbi:MAG TPA: hypothetical protein VF884_04470, partial [Nitrososphaeraceae archaeon]
QLWFQSFSYDSRLIIIVLLFLLGLSVSMYERSVYFLSNCWINQSTEQVSYITDPHFLQNASG